MAIILFDHPDTRKNLLPFTYTRPVSEIRIGIFTITEKWEKCLSGKAGWLTENYLQKKFPFIPDAENLFINGAACPDALLVEAIQDLPENTALVKDNLLIAFRSTANVDFNLAQPNFEKSIEYRNGLTVIDKLWKIFIHNREQILADFELVKQGNSHLIKDPHTIVYGAENIFIEEGATVKAAILNAENGPIYLGKNSMVGEGAIVKGPFALGENSMLNLGARIIGDTTIGPCCKVGGEISNSVFFGHSSKVHDGFFGNSVVGEWCNVGADSNTSNLKNNYKKVNLWNYAAETVENTGLQFCGLMMGDHAKCGINTMFNTGTVVGVGANIFGEGFSPHFIPSFAWGGTKGFDTFRFEKFVETAEVAMQRRSKQLKQEDINILRSVFDSSAKFRTWEG